MKIVVFMVVVDGKWSIKPQKKVMLCKNTCDRVLKLYYLFLSGS